MPASSLSLERAAGAPHVQHSSCPYHVYHAAGTRLQGHIICLDAIHSA